MSSITQEETIEVILASQEGFIERLRDLVTVFEEAAATAMLLAAARALRDVTGAPAPRQ